ncbi:aldose 1-epimerase [Winogradskyella ouciana]|uniref:Aldose 1-epimerase n=1 Tax=Winogradskyella ouciana TaxID=2608631 RepID=A0A7K1GD98_9FLAO|nr:aldose 1-epimerase [Winogradskyella ouciana]MTE26378.1 aldose 1-epimerase [Winogradskyella ouciana]
MYKIEHVKSENSKSLVISNQEETNTLLINLDEGGRVASYKHKGINIISDIENSPYNKSYAAAILFPFANRIENGEYVFNASSYKLPCNEKGNNNAIHGLVYNKSFKLIGEELKSDTARIVLYYKEKNGYQGFPYKFSIWLIYILNNGGFSVTVKVKNDDDYSFPFTLGWHPYFISSDLQQSQLIFNAKEKFLSDEKGIVLDREKFTTSIPIQLGKIELDDAFTVNSNIAKLITPDYTLKLESSSAENYLQIYTPEELNAIAIEPMVGVSNSLNNGIGLNVLDSNETYEKEWILKISKN